MSSVSSIGSSTNYGAYNLFSKLDTSGKGYIEESDLQTALASVSSTGSSDTSELFSQLDSDGDGKVTEDEFTTVLSKLAESLESQYNQSRMEGAMPPPPPPVEAEDDAGFTEEELTSQLEEIGSTDSARSSLISSILEDFDAADTDSDGKVSGSEAMAYAEANGISTSTSTGATATTSTDGFTVDELTSQLEEIGSTDPVRASLISSIVQNFDAADTNEDGTVSTTEAMAYAQSNGISTVADDASSSSATDSGSESAASDAKIFRQLAELMRSYGNGDNSFMNALNSSISTSA
jgi:Ca2+-binding EF-hand superfamily protein